MNQWERELYAEVARLTREVMRLVDQHPERRAELAYAMLGAAVAVCDSFGLSAEEWLAELRSTCTRPAILVPPKTRQS